VTLPTLLSRAATDIRRVRQRESGEPLARRRLREPRRLGVHRPDPQRVTAFRPRATASDHAIGTDETDV